MYINRLRQLASSKFSSAISPTWRRSFRISTERSVLLDSVTRPCTVRGASSQIDAEWSIVGRLEQVSRLQLLKVQVQGFPIHVLVAPVSLRPPSSLNGFDLAVASMPRPATLARGPGRALPGRTWPQPAARLTAHNNVCQAVLRSVHAVTSPPK